ncbi:hypothetical protein DICVIV_08944 [Dictyocaulus viviparus]|uniref:Uncharacterized protein n=1 Tax=Dictyocaulus viviparus TaxID=29172 RepID=A0A0D8XK80_DICVI|nr:hypothetical protein DICVIV_08944 [Dictyocaulus viviparus]
MCWIRRVCYLTVQNEDSQLEDCSFFDEGLCVIDGKLPTAKELHVVIAYRLHVLHLLDGLRGCAESLRHDIDDETRITFLLSLCELCNEISGIGKQEVIWMLAQKYLYYLMDIIEHTASSSTLRSSAALALSIHLLELVLISVDDPKFWVRQAKAFCRLLSKRYITPSTPKLYEYIAPFLDPMLQTIGSGGSEVVMCLYKKMIPAMERLVDVNPTIIVYARLLETVIVHANHTTRLEIFHVMEHERIFDIVARWLFDLVQHRHALWQMGEPVISEASKGFLAFAFPILRTFAAYFKVCGSFVGEMAKLGTLSDVLLDALILVWGTTSGMNGQKYDDICRQIRLAVLDVLNPSLLCEKSLGIIIRHLVHNCSRPHLLSASLGIFLNLVPCAPPLVITKTHLPSWKDVVIRHRQRLNRFVNAFCACERKEEIAEILLAPSPYIFEMSKAFVDRMCRLDFRLAQELVEILLKYMLTSFESRQSSKSSDSTVTPVGSVTGEDVLKETETNRPASTGMVRQMESFIHLCKVHQFRIVLHYFLSRYPSRYHYLSPILSQFEKPTFDSERQSRFQFAVLDLLSGLCLPSLWSVEFITSDCEGYVFKEFFENYSVKEVDGSDPFTPFSTQERENGVAESTEIINEVDGSDPFTPFTTQERENGVAESTEIINDEIEIDDSALGLELVEETDCDSQPTSSLEAILVALCRFVNNPDQKIRAVQYALEIMAKATSDVVQGENASFVKMISGCLRRIGLRALFERLNNSFDLPEVMPCLYASTVMLDILFQKQPNILMEVLDCSSLDRLLESIISQINNKSLLDASAKSVLETLNRYNHLLCEYNETDEVSHEEVEVPLMYGKSDAVAELYCGPLVTVVTKTSESYKRFRKASSDTVSQRNNEEKLIGPEKEGSVKDKKA